MKAVLVIGNNYTYNSKDFENKFVVGVDKGAIYCLDNNIKMDYAVGDFDSCNNEMIEKLYYHTSVKKLNPIKDETDTFEAISLCKDCEEILILGGIAGNRIEHFIANVIEMKNNSKIKMKDDNSYMISTCESFNPYLDDYKFISLFALEDSIITLENMKYNLNKYKLSCNDALGISNEFCRMSKITIHEGRLLIIYSLDDNEKENV